MTKRDIWHIVTGTLIVAGSVASLVTLFVPRDGGDTTTAFVPGIPDDNAAVSAGVIASYPPSFQDVSGLTDEQSEANRTKNIRLWGPTLTLNPGPQQTTDCVSWGKANAVKVRRWVASNGIDNRDISTLYDFGTARVTVGKHRPACGRPGAYPAYAVQAYEQYGYLFTNESGLPPYSGSAASQIGCNGPSPQQIQQGRTRAGGTCQPLPTAIALRNALSCGYPATFACPWLESFARGETYIADGRRVLKQSGKSKGGHQTCIIGYDGSGSRPYFYLMNSHGAGWPKGSPMNGEPPGGVWITAETAQWGADVGEIWAISDLKGFTADELDLRVFDGLNLGRATPPQPPRKESGHVLAKSTLAP